jgi:hypothetical protein
MVSPLEYATFGFTRVRKPSRDGWPLQYLGLWLTGQRGHNGFLYGKALRNKIDRFVIIGIIISNGGESSYGKSGGFNMSFLELGSVKSLLQQAL